MTEILKSFEFEFDKYISGATSQLDAISAASSGDQMRMLRGIENDITEAEKILKQMDIQVAALDKSVKSRYVDKYKELKKNLDSLRKDHLKKQNEVAMTSGKESLFAGANQEARDGQQISKASRIVEQNNKLVAAKRVAFETEDISIGIQRELNRNTEVLTRAIGRTKEADQEIGKSNKLLNQIGRRMMMNKLTLYSVLAVVCLVFVLIFYLKFK
eukprot:TRINITY_DN6990_c0_g1_i4.p1 TRINITY_DN6990_c0_g1~~TRINITY_DN6990_c0_g1_i4.p1  ORF type:complete len:215 (+),score=44.75 TRINITY_DN6990_c0_g1_i4:34-678(+)